MSFTELLRSVRTSRVTVLHKFLTSYDPNSQRVYAFVEGNPDQAFYRAQIQKYLTDGRDVYLYNCEGKQAVYDTYRDVLVRHPACTRALFFVDKDVDDLIGRQWPTDPRIFITDVYSIENYVICRESMARYFKDFVKIRRVEIDVERVLAEFENNLNLFHRLILPLMAWIVVMRRAGSRVVLTNVDLGALFAVSDRGTIRQPKRRMIDYLCRVTNTTPSGQVWRQVKRVCSELKSLPAKAYIRGKFEAWWFIEFGRRVSEGLCPFGKPA